MSGDSRPPDQRVVDGLREFYLGYLSTHLPHEAFDRVRRATVTDVAIHILRDIRAELAVEEAAQSPYCAKLAGPCPDGCAVVQLTGCGGGSAGDCWRVKAP